MLDKQRQQSSHSPFQTSSTRHENVDVQSTRSNCCVLIVKNRMRNRWTLLLIAFLVWVLVGERQYGMARDVPLVWVRDGRIRERTELRGYEVSLNHSMTVTGLGKYDANGNGTLDDLLAPQVGLWDLASQTRLADVTIPLDATAVDGFFWQPIERMTLPSGDYIVGTQIYAGQEPYLYRADLDYAAPVQPLTVGRRRSDVRLEFPIGTSTMIGFGANLLVEAPPISLQQPLHRSVTQRADHGGGVINVQGRYDLNQFEQIQVRASSITSDGTEYTEWQAISTAGGEFSGTLRLPAAGWYDVEARGVVGETYGGNVSVTDVGVGEVFVIAGQSNSANSGQFTLSPESDWVRAPNRDRSGWRVAHDPQPVATGLGGSPWPPFGDLMVESLEVPVGVISVGWGGTRVDQWLPDSTGPAKLYERLRTALEFVGPGGARSVLWHQGESDTLAEKSADQYARELRKVIAQSRVDAGFDIPWGVALASFMPTAAATVTAEIRQAQLQVIEADPLVFQGADTDDLLGDTWRYDRVHFNEVGLREHARRWHNAVLPIIVPEPSTAGSIWWVLAWILWLRSRATTAS